LGGQQTREGGNLTPQTFQFLSRNHFFFGVDVWRCSQIRGAVDGGRQSGF
jgi:hypothetical protein